MALFATLWSPAHADDGVTIRVRVQEQGVGDTKTPLPKVKISVLDAGGAEVVSGVTDNKGVAALKLPKRADVTVRLDESTLPSGAALSEQTPAERKVKADDFITATLNVNYFVGEAKQDTASWWARLAQRAADGTRLGLILAMCAVGLSLIFGTTGLTNFAHGEMVTFGGIVACLFNASWGVPLLIAAPIAVVLGGVFGIGLDRVVFLPLRKKGIGLISQMVVTVGLSIVFRNLFLALWGGRVRQFADFLQQSEWRIGPIGVTPRDFTTALISLVVLVLVALALQRTRLGKATRAVSDNPDLASSTGIDSQKIIRIVWFIGGAMAALGGIFRGLDQGVSPDMGGDLLFLMFAGITLGGLGSPFGALVGGFVVGLFVEMSTMFGVPSELKKVPALVALILMLLVRPQGILGRRDRVG
ncbi:MAG: branched-chain amino acid ABC transporter permease [Actinomycetota bacterium]|jgi:branched-chain amino acid transport system permease protein